MDFSCISKWIMQMLFLTAFRRSLCIFWLPVSFGNILSSLKLSNNIVREAVRYQMSHILIVNDKTQYIVQFCQIILFIINNDFSNNLYECVAVYCDVYCKFHFTLSIILSKLSKFLISMDVYYSELRRKIENLYTYIALYDAYIIQLITFI